MWIAWPSAASVASRAASDRVGWAWIVWMISSSVASRVRPDGELVDDLGRLGPDDVHAEDLAGRLVGDHLDEPVRLAERDRLAARRERELPDRRPRGPFSRARASVEPDRGDLGTAVGAGGDVAVVDGTRALARRSPRPPPRLRPWPCARAAAARHVADRVEPFTDVSMRRRDLDEPALELDAERSRARGPRPSPRVRRPSAPARPRAARRPSSTIDTGAAAASRTATLTPVLMRDARGA